MSKDNKKVENNKNIKISIGRIFITVMLLLIVIVGGTFAWLSYRSRESALVLTIGDLTNIQIKITPYHIRDKMVPVNTYTNGVYSQIEVTNNESGAMPISLFYNINEITSELVNNGLKYTIVSSSTRNGTYTVLKTGDFTGYSNNQLKILEDYVLGNTAIYYRVYLWLDSSVGDQSSIQNSSLDIELNAYFGVSNASFYAVYSETDNSLRFYDNSETITEGSTYNNLVATKVYTAHENDVYEYDSTAKTTTSPWDEIRDNVINVVFEDEISPMSTANWFNRFTRVSTINLTNLDTSNTVDMTRMFDQAGKDETVESFTITGLGNLDTSKVTSMFAMLQSAGYYATTFSVGDLSEWNVSNVLDMRGLFNFLGYTTTSFNIGDLSDWDVSNVTNMRTMFQESGTNATTWSVGDLSGWDTSSVINMYAMFAKAGYSATTFDIGNLNNWNTSSVTDMYAMFSKVGYNATTWSIGDLSGWDVSNVTNMKWMFERAGYTATTFNINLSGWDTSKVTDMYGMFHFAGYTATTFDIGNLNNWNVSSVTDMHNMFNSAGHSATTTWNIGDLSSWNVSNVTDMYGMFHYAGYKTATFNIGNLNNWNTSSVTDMAYMFTAVGYSATTWNIGNLSGWNTANVTDMTSMFNKAGYSASYSMNLYNWNVAKVTAYDDFDYYVEEKIISPWDTPSVISFSLSTSTSFYGDMDVTMEALEGMTWKEWLESDYINTVSDTYFSSGTGFQYDSSGDYMYWGPAPCYYILGPDGNYVKGSDVIVANYNYISNDDTET